MSAAGVERAGWLGRFAGAAPRADAHADAAVDRAVATLRPGWLMLRDGDFPGKAKLSVAVRCALVHPRVGVALLSVTPDRPTPDAEDRLRCRLDDLQFRAIFGNWPPIVYRHLSAGEMHRLAGLLGRDFARDPPLWLDGGDAWVGAVLRALTLRPLDIPPGADAPARRRRFRALRFAVRSRTGLLFGVHQPGASRR